MNEIKYYALDENEEVPYEFVVIRNVNGEPEFYASFVNTNSLAYENGVLLKFHKRNDELRAENAKLREQVATYEGTPQEDVIDYLRQECIDWEDRYRTLAAENEKLRNKISESWLFSSKLLLAIVMSRSYDELFEAAQGMFRDGSLDGEKGLDELIRKRVDELGVEVN